MGKIEWVFFIVAGNVLAHYCHVWRTLIARSPSLCINPYPDLSGSSAGSFAASACRRLSYIVKRFIVVGSWRQFVAPPVKDSATTSTSPPSTPSLSPSLFQSLAAAAAISADCDSRCMCRRHDDAHLTTTVMLIGCFVNTNLVNDVARWVVGGEWGNRGKLPSIVRAELWVTQGANCLKATYKLCPIRLTPKAA